MENLTYKQLNRYFDSSLKRKTGRGIVRGRVDIEDVPFSRKVDYVYTMIKSLRLTSGLTYRIQFWENTETIVDLIEQACPTLEYHIYKEGKYRTRRTGICLVRDTGMDKRFFHDLLTAHFGFELGKEPGLNMQVHIAFSTPDIEVFFDIYDDRGFYQIWKIKSAETIKNK